MLGRMFRRAAIVGIAALAPVTAALAQPSITGAGATLPLPVYARWAKAYEAATDVRVNYQSIGSGGGIRQIKSGTVTFGASDMPLKPAALEAIGLVQFPAIIGGVVPVLNVPGLHGELTLTGDVLARLYSGEIKKWNDAAVKQLNPDVELPDLHVAPVYRSDGSGTTFLFTDYLSKASPNWAHSVGASTSVRFPVGIGAKGNEGVAAVVGRTRGALGYVEYAYAKQTGLRIAKLVNREGRTVTPDAATFQAAAEGADWAGTPGFGVVLTDQPGANAWPITGASYILVHRAPRDPADVQQALRFFAWAYAEGDEVALQLGYVPLPQPVVDAVKQHLANSLQGVDITGLR
ncbi:MAG TPA: phosphate ABC transporter substrate-binding protein PstS [Alphaproteobacteria bacterium]